MSGSAGCYPAPAARPDGQVLVDKLVADREPIPAPGGLREGTSHVGLAEFGVVFFCTTLAYLALSGRKAAKFR